MFKTFAYRDPVVAASIVLGIVGGALPFLASPFKSDKKTKPQIPQA
jgi:hypothetical protein